MKGLALLTAVGFTALALAFPRVGHTQHRHTQEIVDCTIVGEGHAIDFESPGCERQPPSMCIVTVEVSVSGGAADAGKSGSYSADCGTGPVTVTATVPAGGGTSINSTSTKTKGAFTAGCAVTVPGGMVTFRGGCTFSDP